MNTVEMSKGSGKSKTIVNALKCDIERFEKLGYKKAGKTVVKNGNNNEEK